MRERCLKRRASAVCVADPSMNFAEEEIDRVRLAKKTDVGNRELFLQVRVICMTGRKNYRKRGPAGSDRIVDLETGCVGEAHVEYHEVWLEAADRIDRFAAGADAMDHHSFHFEESLDTPAYRVVVLDHQDTQGCISAARRVVACFTHAIILAEVVPYRFGSEPIGPLALLPPRYDDPAAACR